MGHFVKKIAILCSSLVYDVIYVGIRYFLLESCFFFVDGFHILLFVFNKNVDEKNK